MDQFDRATELEERHRALALSAQLAKMVTDICAPVNCVGCGEKNHPERRKLGFNKCIDCAEHEEYRNKFRGHSCF